MLEYEGNYVLKKMLKYEVKTCSYATKIIPEYEKWITLIYKQSFIQIFLILNVYA